MRLFRRGDSASTLDLLVAGLGNPGPEHEHDRHNVGWMVVDELARRCGATFRSKFDGRLSEPRIAGARLRGAQHAGIADAERVAARNRLVGAPGRKREQSGANG